MKKVSIFLISVILMIVSTLSVNAQATSSSDDASGTAKIIAPISLTNTEGLAFGNIAAGSTSGAVYISTTGARTSTGGVTPSSVGAYNNAAYAASGDPNAPFSIILPNFAIISNGTNNMFVNGFTSNPIAIGVFDGSGEQTINVGATLNVNPSQPTGNYTGTYNITITYY